VHAAQCGTACCRCALRVTRMSNAPGVNTVHRTAVHAFLCLQCAAEMLPQMYARQRAAARRSSRPMRCPCAFHMPDVYGHAVSQKKKKVHKAAA